MLKIYTPGFKPNSDERQPYDPTASWPGSDATNPFLRYPQSSGDAVVGSGNDGISSTEETKELELISATIGDLETQINKLKEQGFTLIPGSFRNEFDVNPGLSTYNGIPSKPDVTSETFYAKMAPPTKKELDMRNLKFRSDKTVESLKLIEAEPAKSGQVFEAYINAEGDLVICKPFVDFMIEQPIAISLGSYAYSGDSEFDQGLTVYIQEENSDQEGVDSGDYVLIDDQNTIQVISEDEATDTDLWIIVGN